MNGDIDQNGDLVDRVVVEVPRHLAPGDECPACERRMPYPKKESSPTTKVKAYRVPTDEHEAHKEVLTQAAKHLGTFERPHWEFATYTTALALVLQDERLRGFANRKPA